jgi:hypothetical protein
MTWPWIRRKRRSAGSQPGGETPPSQSSESAGPTLYEDWEARRQQLAEAPQPLGQHREVMLRILEFLITRYRDSPVAERPARFPLQAELMVNERAIVVHHHLKPTEGGRVKSPQEAQQRMAALVERITSYGPEGDVNEAEEEAGEREENVFAEPAWLPEVRSELNRAVRQWREGLEQGEIEPAWDALRPLLRCRPLHPMIADRIRPELAHPNPAVRLRAIWILGRIGGLDDFGLLSDLLALPPQDDEHPQERTVLVQAIQRIPQASEKP